MIDLKTASSFTLLACLTVYLYTCVCALCVYHSPFRTMHWPSMCVIGKHQYKLSCSYNIAERERERIERREDRQLGLGTWPQSATVLWESGN